MKTLNVKTKLVRIVTLCASALTLLHCAGKDSDGSTSYDTTSAEVAGSAIAGAAAQSDDSSNTIVAMSVRPKTINESLSEILFPKAYATASCSLTPSAKIKNNSAGCIGADMTLTLSSCTAANGLVSWDGTMQLAFSTGPTCTQASTGGMLSMGAGESVNIQSSGGITRTGPLGSYVITDSNSSGYATQNSGGLTVTCVDGACGDGTMGSSRTVGISGIHRAEYLQNGRKLFDHTVSTTTDFAFNGTGSARVLSAGTLVLQHNILLYTATTSISSPISFSAGCCWPTSGTVTTSFSGSKTGSETLSFGPTCGVATVNGTSFSFQQCN